MAALSTLERRIDRHMKESADQIKFFKSELHSMKTVPKSKVQRPCEAIKARDNPMGKKPEQIRQATKMTTDKSNVSSCMNPKASRKPVKFPSEAILCQHCSILIIFPIHRLRSTTRTTLK